MEFLFRKSSLLIYPDDSKSIIAYISSYSCFGICIIYSTKIVSGVLHAFFLLYNTVALTTTPIKVIVNINTIMLNIFLYLCILLVLCFAFIVTSISYSYQCTTLIYYKCKILKQKNLLPFVINITPVIFISQVLIQKDRTQPPKAMFCLTFDVTLPLQTPSS